MAPCYFTLCHNAEYPNPKFFIVKSKQMSHWRDTFLVIFRLDQNLHTDFCNFMSIVALPQQEATKIKWLNKTAVSFETHILCYK
jgi:hypothetical protein